MSAVTSADVYATDEPARDHFGLTLPPDPPPLLRLTTPLPWEDRQGAAKELHDLLELRDVTVWFSEKDVILGTPLLREIDKGLAISRVGIVLVTPAFLERVQGAGIADKELSALLARDQLVPIVHQTTYEALRDVSPLLGSRSGLSTKENSMADIAAKLAELVSP